MGGKYVTEVGFKRWLACATLTLQLWTPNAALAESPASTGSDVAVYRFARPTPIRRCTVNGDDWSAAAAPPPVPAPPVPRTNSAIAQRGWRYYPLKEAKGRIVLQFVSWKHGSVMYSRFNVAVETPADETILWCMDKVPGAPPPAQPYNKLWGVPDLAFGVLVIPVKLRLGIGDRETAFTTGVTLAGALDINRPFAGSSNWRVHVPVFAGVGSVSIAPRESKLTETRDIPAFSLGVGIGISGYGGGAGLLVGWDIINGNHGADSVGWMYQKRAWIGFSVGATFGTSPAEPASAQ